jgi:sugar phosphate isomerase/epimerase
MTRRGFVKIAGLGLMGATIAGRSALAAPWGRPVGLQLYSVREQLAKDYEGTLKQVGGIGYREVEAAGFYNRTAEQVKQAMADAQVKCVGAHYAYTALAPNVDKIIEFHKTLGCSSVVCAYPAHRDAAAKGEFTIDDLRWTIEQLNGIGERLRKEGLQLGYHNHTPEFVRENGVLAYDAMMAAADPKLITFEMDCGWVKVGGGDPVELLKKYPTRISLLHVKDFKPKADPNAKGTPPPAELGRGTIDYRPIFAAAKASNIKHIFVEQEGFDMPPMEALKVDYDYVNGLKG